MTRSGNCIAALTCLLLAMAVPAWAAVDAQVDRGQVYLGDSVRLTLTATDGEDVKEANLDSISRDFEILGRSSSSNISIVNGKRSSTKELRLELTPRRTGELRIPSLDIDGQRTRELRILVSEPPELAASDRVVIFEAEVDRDAVYVQGQLILTLRLSQAINLDSRSISELEIDNAFVKTLEQSSFQRRIDGRPWLVHEVRYAIFPEQSGTLEIPAQTFSGRVREARRTLFDTNRGRLVRRQSEPITVTVEQRPGEYPDATWLPARRVDLIEEWSVPPEQLKAGESATRTVRIVGEGLQGAQLPPVPFTPLDGIKFYPDQPQISDREVTSGLQGVRTDSTAVVPTREGVFEIPELRVPWWDTEREQLRYAVLPARTLNALPSADSPPAIATPDPTSIATTDASVAGGGTASIIWQVVALVSSIGWIATLIALWRMRGSPRKAEGLKATNEPREREAFKELLAACKANDAARTREAAIRWAQAQKDTPYVTTLSAVAAYFEDPEFGRELAALDSKLYAADSVSWRGEELAQRANTVRGTQRARHSKGESNLALYPGAG